MEWYGGTEVYNNKQTYIQKEKNEALPGKMHADLGPNT